MSSEDIAGPVRPIFREWSEQMSNRRNVLTKGEFYEHATGSHALARRASKLQ